MATISIYKWDLKIFEYSWDIANMHSGVIKRGCKTRWENHL